MSAPQLTLYHLGWCGFCVYVRQVASSLQIHLSLIDVEDEPQHRERLLAETGCARVPILGITEGGAERLLAESRPIIAFLQANAKHLSP